jgi:hypothetical protein
LTKNADEPPRRIFGALFIWHLISFHPNCKCPGDQSKNNTIKKTQRIVVHWYMLCIEITQYEQSMCGSEKL